jgi:hypothetical protein
MPTDLLPNLEALGNILSEQLDAHRELAVLALNLKDALVACDHKNIERFTLENERAAGKVKKLETKRLAFLLDAGFADVHLPLSTIMERAMAERELTEDEIAALEKLSSLRAKLAEVINEVDHHNQLNMTLLGQALEFQEFTIRLLLNVATGETTGYTREGPSRQDDRTSLFDGRA